MKVGNLKKILENYNDDEDVILNYFDGNANICVSNIRIRRREMFQEKNTNHIKVDNNLGDYDVKKWFVVIS